jgi:hypothetical protein
MTSFWPPFEPSKRKSGVQKVALPKKKLLQKLCKIVWQKHITKLLASRYKLSKKMSEKRQNTGKKTSKKCQKRVPPQDQIFSCFLSLRLWFEHFGDEKSLFLIKSIFPLNFFLFNILYISDSEEFSFTSSLFD